MTAYSDIKISSTTTAICTLLAPLLITILLFILHFVSSVEKRLGIIMGLTTLFSIRLVMLYGLKNSPTQVI